MTVFISAGHNPTAQGAEFKDVVVTKRTFTEYGFTVQYADYIHSRCLAANIPAIRVPTGSLSEKIKFINSKAQKGDIAIEVHFNSSAGMAQGCETLYCPNSVKGKELANEVHRAIMATIKGATLDRGIKEGWYKMDVPGIVNYAGDKDGDEVPDAFLSQVKCTALILEPFFMNELSNINSLKELVGRAVVQVLGKK